MEITFEITASVHKDHLEMNVTLFDSIKGMRHVERREVAISDFEELDIRSYMLDMMFERLRRQLAKPSVDKQIMDFAKILKGT